MDNEAMLTSVASSGNDGIVGDKDGCEDESLQPALRLSHLHPAKPNRLAEDEKIQCALRFTEHGM